MLYRLRLRLYTSILSILILLGTPFALFLAGLLSDWLVRKFHFRAWLCFLEIYVVLLGKATLWRAGLVRWRGVGGELRSLSDSEGSVSACGEPVSPTSSRRNLNLDRKSCHTTYQPANQQQISPTFESVHFKNSLTCQWRMIYCSCSRTLIL